MGYEQQSGQQQQLGGQQQYGGMGQMVQQMLSPSIGQLGLGGALSPYAKHNLGRAALVDLDHRVLAGAPLLLRCRLQRQDQLGIGIEAVVAYLCFGVVDRGKWEWDAGRRWSEEVPYAAVFWISAACARTRTRTTAGYDPEQELVRRECEFTSSNSRLYPMSVYISHSFVCYRGSTRLSLSRSCPQFLVHVLTTSFPPLNSSPSTPNGTNSKISSGKRAPSSARTSL